MSMKRTQSIKIKESDIGTYMKKLLISTICCLSLFAQFAHADEGESQITNDTPHLDFKVIANINGQLIKLYDDMTWDYIKDPFDASEWFN